MIDNNCEDIIKEYNTLKSELKKYNSDLLDRPSLLFITKSDTYIEDCKNLKLPKNIKSLIISSIDKTNISNSIDLMYNALNS